MLKNLFTSAFLLILFASSAHAANCIIVINKINVTENGHKKTDEVREHQYNLEDKQSCFKMAQKRLSFYPSTRSYYGSISRSEQTQSFLYRGKIDVYYFADYEFVMKTPKSKKVQTSKGRIQKDSNHPGINPVIGRYGEIILSGF